MSRFVTIGLLAGLLCCSLSTALAQPSYQELPLGQIKPQGWLKEMLETQLSGATGQLDALYPAVMGPRNGWLGGDGDQWERGPYWIDGLLPLAYILGDEQAKQKVQPWIEWTLQSQQPNGFFGPAVNYPAETGLQRNNSQDWWPRMVMLKIMKQYYMATGDERVIPFLSRYFKYQLETLPTTPLGTWTHWAQYRACDNMDVVYWVYTKTHEPFLLELMDLLHAQSFNYTQYFSQGTVSRQSTIHCVNLAQGLKEPIIYFQKSRDSLYVEAVEQGLDLIRQYHGQPQGLYGGDETLHGNNPTQGSELCSAVELMYSLERMVQITGKVRFADHLEQVAFNALPTQISDDFMTHQYFQQANQVTATKAVHNFSVNHRGMDVVFGLLTGYPCCTSNMHQGWPKFTQNLWYGTSDHGIAALVYAPSTIQWNVSEKNIPVTITEDTYYPMDDVITFTIQCAESVSFPFSLRIPAWCKQADLRLNGKPLQQTAGNTTLCLDREWHNGDKLELKLNMHIYVDYWHEGSVAIHRGPLTYALKMDEKWQYVELEAGSTYGTHYYEVTSSSPWNYGLLNNQLKEPDNVFEVVVDREKMQGDYPWNVENAPIEIKVPAKRIPSWTLYNQMAGPLPYSVTSYSLVPDGQPIETITLIPYGCTTLRISEFPRL